MGSPIITYDYIGGGKLRGTERGGWRVFFLGEERSLGGLQGGEAEENGINVVESECWG